MVDCADEGPDDVPWALASIPASSAAGSVVVGAVTASAGTDVTVGPKSDVGASTGTGREPSITASGARRCAMFTNAPLTATGSGATAAVDPDSEDKDLRMLKGLFHPPSLSRRSSASIFACSSASVWKEIS